MEPSEEQSKSWVQQVLVNPRNLATEAELMGQIRVAVKAFVESDVDKSGAITFDELRNLCEFMGLPLEGDEEEVLHKMDKDGSSTLELEEWVMWWLSRVSCLPNPEKQQEAIARNTFRKFDRDKSGVLEVSELTQVLSSLGAEFTENEMKEVVDVLDTDHSGQIEENEFVAWWTNKTSDSRKSGGLIAAKLRKLATKASQVYNTDIFVACWQNEFDLVKIFLETDKRLANATDLSDYADGWMPLHYACYRGHLQVVEELLKAGAGVNRGNAEGFTALFYAAQQGHIELCRRLLDAGADPSACGITSTDPDLFMCPVEHCIDFPELTELFRSHPKCTPPQQLDVPQISASLKCDGTLTVNTPVQRLFSGLPIKKWQFDLNYYGREPSQETVVEGEQPSEDKAGDDKNGGEILDSSGQKCEEAKDESKRSDEKLSAAARRKSGSGDKSADAKNVSSKSEEPLKKAAATKKPQLPVPRKCQLFVRAKPPGKPQIVETQLDKGWVRQAMRVLRTKSADNEVPSVVLTVTAWNALGDCGPPSEEILVDVTLLLTTAGLEPPATAEAKSDVPEEASVRSRASDQAAKRSSPRPGSQAVSRNASVGSKTSQNSSDSKGVRRGEKTTG